MKTDVEICLIDNPRFNALLRQRVEYYRVLDSIDSMSKHYKDLVDGIDDDLVEIMSGVGVEKINTPEHNVLISYRESAEIVDPELVPINYKKTSERSHYDIPKILSDWSSGNLPDSTRVGIQIVDGARVQVTERKGKARMRDKREQQKRLTNK